MAKCIRCGRQLPGFSFKKVCQWCLQHEAAQRGEDTDDAKQRVMPAPWVRRSESTISLTQILFGANIAVFLAMALASGTVTSDFPGGVAVHFGANYGPYTLSGDWWRLFTYMFLHGGIWHIVFNMWCLWDLGALCESLYGRWTYLCIYVITGIAGGLASVGWNPVVLSVGASGAIFGLAGALATSFYLGEFTIPRFAIQGTLRSLAFFIGFNVLFGIGYNVFLGGNSGVDNACHVGGLVSGAILGAMIARLAPQEDAPMRRFLVVGAVAIALVGAGFWVRQWRGGPMRMARTMEAIGQGGGDSLTRLQAIVKQSPNLAPAHLALAEAYFARQKFPEAEGEFKRVLELQPQNAQAQFDLGITYLNEKRPDQAKAIFTQMLAQKGNSGVAHYGLGLALADQQNYEAAIAEFKAATETGSPISGIYYEMGNSYSRLKKYDEAIAAYQEEKKKEDDPDLENALADAYQAKGMAQEAQEARTRAEQLKNGQSQK